MHEMSLCLSMLEILESSAREHQFQRVKVIHLELGRHSCADPETLRFTFNVAAQNTLAEGARLDILEVPVRAWCHRCERLVDLAEDVTTCPACSGSDLRLEGGQDMRIKNLEVE